MVYRGSMKKQLPRTQLIAEGEWEKEWTVSAPSLPELKRLLGLPLLVEFCRSSIAADRLVSLGDFGIFNDQWQPRLAIAHDRNLQTMFWLTCGTIHEAIDALAEMELLGVEGLLASFKARQPWIELKATVSRWNQDPVYQRARNKVAFHIDARAIRKGINTPGRDDEPVVWKKGNTTKDRSTVFTFAEDCLLSGVFPGDLTGEQASERFGTFAASVRDVHLHFSGWTQELFIAAVRGAELGLKLTPRERPKCDELSDDRLKQIEEIEDEVPAGLAKEALGDLVREIRRLTGLQRRRENDPAAAEADRRRKEEEGRLRAIAATAKQYVTSKSPSAEKRLLELLEMSGQE